MIRLSRCALAPILDTWVEAGVRVVVAGTAPPLPLFAAASSASRLPLRQLACAYYVRHRRAQLVAGQFHKSPLGLIRPRQLAHVLLQLARHFIKVARQLPQLIVAKRRIFFLVGIQPHIQFPAPHGRGRFAQADDRQNNLGAMKSPRPG